MHLHLFLTQGSTDKMILLSMKASLEGVQGQEQSWEWVKQEVAFSLSPHVSLTGFLASLCWQELARTQK